MRTCMLRHMNIGQKLMLSVYQPARQNYSTAVNKSNKRSLSLSIQYQRFEFMFSYQVTVYIQDGCALQCPTMDRRRRRLCL